MVTFDCGRPAAITLTRGWTITADTSINGGDLITLSVGASTNLFVVSPAVLPRLQHLILDRAVIAGFDRAAVASLGNLWLESSTIESSRTNTDQPDRWAEGA